MTAIPRCKADVIRRREGGRCYPALNVKVYGPAAWDADRIAAEFKCTRDVAEHAGNLAFENAQERFWNERALDCINFAMLGDERASELKPCGDKAGPFAVYGAGRSSGWLIVEGLADVDTWGAVELQKWRKFARLIRAEIADLLSWEQVREDIEANNYAQEGAERFNFIDRKDGTVACISELKAAARAAGFGPVVRA